MDNYKKGRTGRLDEKEERKKRLSMINEKKRCMRFGTVL